MGTPEISNPGHLMEMINGFRTSRIILTAYELGLFNFLKGKSVSSGEVARLLGTHPRATDRLMNALVALGLLKKSENLFFNTGFSERYLVSGSPDFLGGISHSVHLWNTWNTLTPAVAAGTSVVMGDSIFDRSEEWRESFIAAMHQRGIHQAMEVAAALSLPSQGKILDVGGGSGVFAFSFIHFRPELHAVVFDLPNIVPFTHQYIKKAGLENFVSTLAGDYLVDDFGRDYQLIFMSAIIHINSPEENERLIQRGVNALSTGGQLVILDHVMNDDRTEPAAGAIFAINMLVGTDHGDTYTEKEISFWMEKAGLSEVRIQTTPSGIQLMTGIKK
ncbi:MAG: acetylserotonin O-methyltransferase [Bacteroidales bacterium]|jgi:SAM-dependent methyltransferase|nr:acetylserotonin O-methyltransferase [Bacteroidales bacterium]